MTLIGIFMTVPPKTERRNIDRPFSAGHQCAICRLTRKGLHLRRHRAYLVRTDLSGNLPRRNLSSVSTGPFRHRKMEPRLLR